MKSSVESISNLEKKITVEIPVEKVNEEFLNAYKYLQKNVAIKGFRKGKAPIDSIRKMYQDKVRDDVSQNLVQQGYIEALQEHDLTPVGMPKLDIQACNEDQELVFTLQFEVQPDIELTKLEGLEVEKEKIDITADQVDQAMQKTQENHAKLEDVKLIRELALGDFAVIDFKGFIDDKPLDNGEAKDHMLEIGSNQFIEGFEEKLVGMKTGDNRKIQLSFPEDYHVDELKGKPVLFDVTLNGIKKKVLPEWNEEFLKTLGEYDNLDDYKDKLKQQMQDYEGARVQQDLKNRLFKELVKENPFQVPQTLIQEQRQMLVEDFRQKMQGQGISQDNFKDYQEKWASDFDETAEFMVRSALLIQKIAKDNDIQVDPADLEEKYKEMAQTTGLPVEKVREFYQQQNSVANLQFQLTEQKVFDFVLDKSTVKEVEKEQLSDTPAEPN